MVTDGVDPFQYTIDQTIHALSPYLDEHDAQRLRVNEVTGCVLLKSASHKTLKEEFGIIPFGRRLGIMETIWSLQQQSAGYRNFLAQKKLQPPSLYGDGDDDGDLMEILPLCLPSTPVIRKRKRELQALPHVEDRPEELPRWIPPSPPNTRLLTPNRPSPLELISRETPLHVLNPFAVGDREDVRASYLDMDGVVQRPDLRGEKPAWQTENREEPKWIMPAVDVQDGDETDDSPTSPIFHDALDELPVIPVLVHDDSPAAMQGIGIELRQHPPSPRPPDAEELPEERPGPKRIEPINTGPIGDLDAHMSISESEPKPLSSATERRTILRKRYLPPKAKKIETLFYDVEVGEDITLDYDGDDQFQLVSSGSRFSGENKYVGRRIRRLLKDNGQILEDFSMGFATGSATGQLVRNLYKGHPRAAIKHYGSKERYLRKYEQQSFTVFDVESKEHVRAHRQTTKTLRLPWPSASTLPSALSASDIQIVRHAAEPETPGVGLNSDDNSNHDFDYLLKWQNIDGAENVLPLYGESGDEGEYDEKTWREFQAEFGPHEKVPVKHRHRASLGKEEIEEAFDESIREAVRKWRELQMPKLESHQAYGLWSRAKKFRCRKWNIHKAQDRIAALDARLTKIKEQFLNSSMNWSSTDGVRKLARKAVEVTINDREYNKWLIDLMGRQQEPTKPQRKAKALDAHVGEKEVMMEDVEDKALVRDGDDEESIGSETDEDRTSDGEGDEMAGFIIDGPDIPMGLEDGSEDELGSMEEEAEDKRVAVLGRTVVADSQGDDSDVDMENSGHSESEQSPAAPIKSEQHTPQAPSLRKAPSSSDVIDLTGDSPPCARGTNKKSARGTNKKLIPVIDLELDDADMSPPPSPSRSSKGKEKGIDRNPLPTPGPEREKRKEDERLEILRELLLDDPLLRNIYYGILDLQGKNFAGWFGDIKLALRSLSPKRKVGIGDTHREALMRLVCKLYIAWAFCRRGVKDGDLVVSRAEVKILGNLQTFESFTQDVVKIAAPMIGGDASDSGSHPSNKLEKLDLKKQHQKRPGPRSLGEVSSADERDYQFEEIDDSYNLSGSQSHRKRKRQELVEDQSAKDRREGLLSIHKNIKRRILEQRKKARLKGEKVGGDGVMVNLGHYANQKPILVPGGIAGELKPHQIEGVRFLWQSLVQTDRGALLAHTMGLGKTLQVIAFLYTLAESGASQDEAVYGQIPAHLRKSKTLVMSPPGLVDNWWDELHNWLPFDPKTTDLDPKYIGKIYRADGTTHATARREALNEWNANGGILLIGYAMFRRYILNCNTNPLRPHEHEAIRKILLEGPNIIVADEAHYLKNNKSQTAQAASLFKSYSRIAMTGSPLSNNLLEYWSMIEWIDPGFLGPEAEFRRKYVSPIKDGLYADSSHGEKRTSLKMLRVLKSDLSVKISRADVDVIKSEMPSKTEFRVTVPLTDLQMDMYQRYLDDPATRDAATRFFDISHLLLLICGHPAIFVKKMEQRKREKEAGLKLLKQAQQAPFEDVEGIEPLEDGVEDVDKILDETGGSYHWARTLLDENDGENIEHSYRMLAFREILRHSIALGDSVLVFTHSIPTLDVLESHVKNMQLKYFRLDGKTAINTRQKSAKHFNTMDSTVFLISTQAGGLGLNLFGANRVVIFDFKWSPMWEQQAVGRAYRLGQKKHVFVYRFCSGGTFEDRVWNNAQFKSQLQRRVVDQKAPIREAHKKTAQFMAPPKRIEREDVTEFLGMDSVLDNLIKNTDYIFGIEYTETFQPDTDDALTEQEKMEADELLKQEQNLRKQVEDTKKAAFASPLIPAPPTTGPPTPALPTTGPPTPAPPATTGPPIPAPPTTTGPPIPAPPTTTGPPIPAPPTTTGPPIPAPPTTTGPPIPAPPTTTGPPIPAPPTTDPPTLAPSAPAPSTAGPPAAGPPAAGPPAEPSRPAPMALLPPITNAEEALMEPEEMEMDEQGRRLHERIQQGSTQGIPMPSTSARARETHQRMRELNQDAQHRRSPSLQASSTPSRANGTVSNESNRTLSVLSSQPPLHPPRLNGVSGGGNRFSLQPSMRDVNQAAPQRCPVTNSESAAPPSSNMFGLDLGRGQGLPSVFSKWRSAGGGAGGAGGGSSGRDRGKGI